MPGAPAEIVAEKTAKHGDASDRGVASWFVGADRWLTTRRRSAASSRLGLSPPIGGATLEPGRCREPPDTDGLDAPATGPPVNSDSWPAAEGERGEGKGNVTVETTAEPAVRSGVARCSGVDGLTASEVSSGQLPRRASLSHLSAWATPSTDAVRTG